MVVVLVAMGALAPVSSGSPGTKKRIDRVVQRALSVECQASPGSSRRRSATLPRAPPCGATLGVLRRPQAAAETISASEFYLPIRSIRRSSIRFVDAGTRDYVIFVADSIRSGPASVRRR